MIDLRSDTVTLPSPEMRRAMYEAELGDDVYGEDPTVNRLQEMAAEIMGKEAALLVASGTMGNLVAIMSHCSRGQEVIVGDKSHIYQAEAGSASVLWGTPYRAIPTGKYGALDPDRVEAEIHPDDPHYGVTGLICLENTHNYCGGTVVRPEELAAVAAVARKHALPVHLDGARIFNAAVALKIPVQQLTRHADSVTFCLSKGLSCPVGSVLCGSKEFIALARRNRKLVGGGMRQAGVLAAAGIVALNTMVHRLEEDHYHARILAEGLADMPHLTVDLDTVQTNMVYFRIDDAVGGWRTFQQRLAERGVLVSNIEPDYLRAVTHYGIGRRDIDLALLAIREVIMALSPS
jgi:threonine aldolase